MTVHPLLAGLRHQGGNDAFVECLRDWLRFIYRHPQLLPVSSVGGDSVLHVVLLTAV